MSQVECKIGLLPAEGLTVGDSFTMSCAGEWPEMKIEALELRLEEADKYKLKLQEFKATSKTEAELKVTSYKVGTHKLKAVQLVDSEHSVVLSDLEFTVKSLINPQDPPAEPYGPVGPFQISVPVIYWLILAAIVSSLGGYVGVKFYRRNQRKKLLQSMRLSESAQDASSQFYGGIRKLGRQYAFFSGGTHTPEEISACMNQLNEAFRFYVARKLLVPTTVWSDRMILNDIKKHHPIFFEDHNVILKKSFAELSRALRNSNTSVKDVQQILDLIRKAVDQMEKGPK